MALVLFEIGRHVPGPIDRDAAPYKSGVAAPTEQASDVQLSLLRRQLLPRRFGLFPRYRNVDVLVVDTESTTSFRV